MDIAVSVVICAVVLFFFFDGIRRGLFRAVFEIVGLIAAFVLAYHYGHAIAAALAGSLKVSHAALLYFFSFVVFIAVLAVFHIIGVVLQKIVSATVLGPVDRIGGAVIGALKGVLIVSLALVIIDWLPLPAAFKDRVGENPLAARIQPVLPDTYRLFMRDAPERPSETIDRLKERPDDLEEAQQRRTA